jgi:hypothetical protein
MFYGGDTAGWMGLIIRSTVVAVAVKEDDTKFCQARYDVERMLP